MATSRRGRTCAAAQLGSAANPRRMALASAVASSTASTVMSASSSSRCSVAISRRNRPIVRSIPSLRRRARALVRSARMLTASRLRGASSARPLREERGVRTASRGVFVEPARSAKNCRAGAPSSGSDRASHCSRCTSEPSRPARRAPGPRRHTSLLVARSEQREALAANGQDGRGRPGHGVGDDGERAVLPGPSPLRGSAAQMASRPSGPRSQRRRPRPPCRCAGTPSARTPRRRSRQSTRATGPFRAEPGDRRAHCSSVRPPRATTPA